MILLHTLLHYYTFLIYFFHLTSIFQFTGKKLTLERKQTLQRKNTIEDLMLNAGPRVRSSSNVSMASSISEEENQNVLTQEEQDEDLPYTVWCSKDSKCQKNKTCYCCQTCCCLPWSRCNYNFQSFVIMKSKSVTEEALDFQKTLRIFRTCSYELTTIM